MKMEQSHLSYTSRNYNLQEAAQNNSLTGTDIFVPVRLFFCVVLHICIAGYRSKNYGKQLFANWSKKSSKNL